MSTPLNEKECIIAMYDSYAKTVMRNQCRNAVKSKRRRQSHEIAGTEKIQYLFETQSHTDIYPSEHLVVYGGTYTCVVTSEKLYHAMSLLPEGQRAVLILDFWYGWCLFHGFMLNMNKIFGKIKSGLSIIFCLKIYGYSHII